ncbi:hypothetical protein FXF53_15955 [Micromonospora sp. WP24]|uniref:DUF6541 family protein n=1 Tax=Micromonospora sp. WP24 TaxID=2604469 RepID=UPI0011D8017D|nr:DUF6541 family protein [Micromonospora sp. WP24]TYB99256.1 hypothetical protein FXF53_15955 [Micromonospora sp. WP24]
MFTTLIALVVALAPGAVLGFALPPGRYRWAVWAASPALTLGLVTVGMAWLPTLGLPRSALAVLVAELVLAGVAVVASRLFWHGLGGADEDGGRPSLRARFRRLPSVRPRWVDMAGLAVPSTISIAFGWLMLGRLVAPPGWDAMNHGFLTRRILDTGSVMVTDVCTSGVNQVNVSCTFYPLSADISWAQAVQLTGGHISTAMAAWSIILGPLALVASVYGCARALNARPIVAACAATAPAFIGPMWVSVINGRINEQTAPCMAGAIALLVAVALRGPHPIRLGLLAGLAGAGLVMTHTYDVLFIGVLTIGVVLALRAPFKLRDGATALGAAVVAGLLPLVPLLGALLGANGERTSNEPALPNMWDKSFEYWVTHPQRYALFGYPLVPSKDFVFTMSPISVAVVITMACLLVSPFCLFIPRLRWARPWFVAGALFTVIGMWTTSSESTAAATLAGLWYGVRERVRSMIFPVYGILTVVGAVVIGIAIQWLVTRLVAKARGLRDSAVPAAVAASVLVLALIGLGAVPSSWKPLRTAMINRAPIGNSYVQAYEWLSEHTPPGKTVAYDRHREFMSWAYADYENPLLFGIPPLPGLTAAGDDYERRWAAFHWLVGTEGARPAGCDVRRFSIEYVIVGKRGIPAATKNYKQSLLDASNKVTLVQKFGRIKIYQVTAAGQECDTQADRPTSGVTQPVGR